MNMKKLLERGEWTWDKLLDIYADFALHYEERFTRLFGFFCFEMEVTDNWWGQDMEVK